MWPHASSCFSGEPPCVDDSLADDSLDDSLDDMLATLDTRDITLAFVTTPVQEALRAKQFEEWTARNSLQQYLGSSAGQPRAAQKEEFKELSNRLDELDRLHGERHFSVAQQPSGLPVHERIVGKEDRPDDAPGQQHGRRRMNAGATRRREAK